MTPEEQIAQKQEKLREEIRQRQELLKAYELVVQDLHNNGTITLPVAENTPVTARHRSHVTIEPAYGYKTRLVRQAIKEVVNPFTIKDLYENLVESGITEVSLESVGTVINRLREADNPDIRIRRNGSGRRPTIYERT